MRARTGSDVRARRLRRTTGASLVLLVLLASACDAPSPAEEVRPEDEPFEGPKRLVIFDDDVGMHREAVAEEGAYDTPDGVTIHVTDPDGGLQLLYVARDPSVTLLAVTCIYGTVSEPLCEQAARRVLGAIGRQDVPIVTGAASSADLGTPTPASDLIVRLVNEHPGEVEIFTSGPFTNVATALMTDPSIKDKWKTLHVMSGEFEMGSDGHRFARLVGGDLNLSLDYPATQHVFEHGGDFPVYPNELMDEAIFTRADFDELVAADTPLSTYVADQVDPWLRFISMAYAQDGFYLHGVIASAVALDPRYAEPAFVDGITLDVVAPPSGKHRWGSIVTRRSPDAVGRHAVYLTLRDASHFHDRWLRRMR